METITEGNMLISLCPAAIERLLVISKETGRTMENLAAAAVEEEALKYFRDRGFANDPAKMKS